MCDDNDPPDDQNGPTINEFWAAVKQLGIHSPEKTSSKHFVGTTRDGSTASIPDPSHLTPDERAAALERLRKVHGEFN